MPPVTGVSGTPQVAKPQSTEPDKSFRVTTASPQPNNTEVAEAVFKRFGLTRADMPQLKQAFKGVDPIAYLAKHLEDNPRSTVTKDGITTTRISLSAKDYAALEKAGRTIHPRQTDAAAKAAPTNTPPHQTHQPPSDALATKQGYNQTAQQRAAIEAKSQPVAATKGEAKEGIGSFVEGAIKGNFSDNDSWSAIGGQTAVGFVPILGQIADARDIAAAAKQVFDGKPGAWGGLGIAAIAVIPGLDFLKGGSRVGRRVLKEVAEEGLSHVAQNGLRHLGAKVS